MSQDLVSLAFTAEELAALDAAIATVERFSQAFVSLSAEQVRSLAKMGDRSEPFCRIAPMVFQQLVHTRTVALSGLGRNRRAPQLDDEQRHAHVLLHVNRERLEVLLRRTFPIKEFARWRRNYIRSDIESKREKNPPSTDGGCGWPGGGDRHSCPRRIRTLRMTLPGARCARQDHQEGRGTNQHRKPLRHARWLRDTGASPRTCQPLEGASTSQGYVGSRQMADRQSKEHP